MKKIVGLVKVVLKRDSDQGIAVWGDNRTHTHRGSPCPVQECTGNEELASALQLKDKYRGYKQKIYKFSQDNARTQRMPVIRSVSFGGGIFSTKTQCILGLLSAIPTIP